MAGLREVDRLNVCDARDEAAHGYRLASRLGDLPLGATVRVADYAVGRPRSPTRAAPSWATRPSTVRTIPGRDLVVVLRTAPAMDAAVLRLGGGPVVGLALPPGRLHRAAWTGNRRGRVRRRAGGGWDEWVLRVPGPRSSGGPHAARARRPLRILLLLGVPVTVWPAVGVRAAGGHRGNVPGCGWC